MRGPAGVLSGALLLVLALGTAMASTAAGIERFYGKFEGQAVSSDQHEITARDLQVEISPHKNGFTVNWVSVDHKLDGEVKRKSYNIDFYTSRLPHIFQAGMRTDKFGNRMPLDPMHGDPYIWAHLNGPSLTVYAMHILGDGGYEIQTYKRTLTPLGLDLWYSRLRNGTMLRTVTGKLKRAG